MSFNKLLKTLIFSSKLFEGNPMTIIESFKSSLPVIASDVGNAKEMVEDGVTGLHFKTGDAESLIKAIEKLDSIDMLTLKENSYKEFVDKYNQRVGYNNIINIYNRIIEKN